MTDKNTKTADDTAAKFTKAQILESKKFSNRRDALGAILDDQKTYTIAEASDALDKFLKGKVK